MPKSKQIKWDDQPLGRETDSAIARRLGVTPSAVSYQRKRRGIATHAKTPPKRRVPGPDPRSAEGIVGRASWRGACLAMLDDLRAQRAVLDAEITALERVKSAI